MLDIPFFHTLGIGLAICALTSFFVFFAKNLKSFIGATFCFLTGVVYSLIQTDLFAGLKDGRWAACAIIATFIFEFIAYTFVPDKKKSIFFGLPFLAFICLALSANLPMILFGLMLFGLSFVLLQRQRGYDKTQEAFFKINVALLAFSYGIAVIFASLGTLDISKITLQISLKTDDEWFMFGLGLLCLSVIIELYAVFLLLHKRKK